jgi:phytoene dehydrogenase-like protein
LAGGERIEAPVVAASCDPKHLFLNLLAPGVIPYRLEHRIRMFRTRGTTAQLLLALDTPVRFACRPEANGIAFARTGGSLTRLEKAFDAVKYRTFSETPALEVHVPTVAAPDLAPAGHSVMSVLIHFAPYDLEAGWDEAQKERLGNRVVEILETHVPGLKSTIVSGQILSPRDLEERYGITGGHIHHGEHSLDQLLMRPAPECSEYRTPVPGLFLCGAGSHPGGGLTCGPGALAASSILAAAG